MLLDDIWPIMDEAFPLEEKRTYEEQKKIFNNKFFNCHVFKEDNKILGFISYWNFDNFIFIEHLATNKKFRGSGIGTKALEKLQGLNKNLILEVEPISDTNNCSERRVKFYERNGFNYNNFYYEQPPLNKYSNKIELKIMTYPKSISKNEFDNFKRVVYKEVYNIN